MENKPENNTNLYGLIGRNISYSFSAGYFKDKFERLGLKDYHYQNFDLSNIEALQEVLNVHPNLRGFNVTIPYKEEIIPLLHSVDPEAAQIGAVNTVKVEQGLLSGYNTDSYGFETSLTPFLKPWHNHALILGTGGASKAVAYVLQKKGISYQFVSRNSSDKVVTYNELTPALLAAHQIIINCTPLGTFPNIEERPELPYEVITPKHVLYDLIYNPAETTFLKLGKKQGATICNGLRMLELQAEKAWNIWQKP
ncbi:shikimate dehydrogenase family protein [Flavobacteriaceae bacterium M23B6Z8]